MEKNDAAYFAGVICGDGYVSANGSRVEVKDEYKEFLLDVYTPLVIKLFNKFPFTIPESNEAHAYRCYFNSMEVVSLLKSWNIVSPKTFTVCMPSWIREKGIKTKINFVCGAFDADGHINTKKNKGITNYPTIVFQTRSRKFAEDVYNVLREIGLHAKFSSFYKNGKIMFVVRLYGFDQLKGFMNKVKFKHPFKYKKAMKILQEGIRRAGRSTVEGAEIASLELSEKA